MYDDLLEKEKEYVKWYMDNCEVKFWVKGKLEGLEMGLGEDGGV